MKIIAIKSIKSNIVKLILDDNTSYQVSLDSLIKFDLYVDKEITTEELQQISMYQAKRELIAKTIELIQVRPRSKKEVEVYLIKKLRRADYANTLITEIITYLEDKAYINEENFIKWWIANRNAFKPKSKQELIFELSNKGIAKSLIEETLKSSLSSDDEVSHIKAALSKKFKITTVKGLDIKLQQKFISYFLRKGYNYELIRSVIFD